MARMSVNNPTINDPNAGLALDQSSLGRPAVPSNVPRYKPPEVWAQFGQPELLRIRSTESADGDGKVKTGQSGDDSDDDSKDDLEVQTIALPMDSKYVKEVENYFKQTCSGYTVLSVEAVRSPLRWESYALRRRLWKKKLGADRLHERWLWHGTDRNTALSICHQGFLRQFQGRSQWGKNRGCGLSPSSCVLFTDCSLVGCRQWHVLCP